MAGLLLLAPPPAVHSQCAMCKTALTNSAQGRALSASLNKAILVMMAAPYLVAAGFGIAVYRRRLGEAVRRLWPRRR